MPTKFRVMSWNLRTFGSQYKPADDINIIASIIINSRVDMVAIQELMPGRGQGVNINTPISQKEFYIFYLLCWRINYLDPTGKWDLRVTGKNSGGGLHSADAYGFLWKRKPINSAYNLAGPNSDDPNNPFTALTQINAEGVATDGYFFDEDDEMETDDEDDFNPTILRLDNGHFPGRRPGSIRFTFGENEGNIRIISFHAKRPENKMEGAGEAIQQLANLQEIVGGGDRPTIILGDFNYDLFKTDAEVAYHYLLGSNPSTNWAKFYDMRIGTLGQEYDRYQTDKYDFKTTYTHSPEATGQDRYKSSYDNILDNFEYREIKYLNTNENMPNYRFSNAGRIDFIEEVQNWTGADRAAVFHRFYLQQHHIEGVSDHMPVWTEYIFE